MSKTSLLKAALMLASILVIILGIYFHTETSIIYWNRRLFTDFVIWSLLCSILATCLKFFDTPNPALLFILTIFIYLSTGVGWSQSLFAFYFVLSAYAVGRLILYASMIRERARILLNESVIIGVGFYVFLFGVLIHFPVNYAGVYLGILSVPLLAALLLRLPTIYKPQASLAWHEICQKAAAIDYRKLCLSVIVIGYVARYAFFPSVNYDDNASHLRMWTMLSNQHIHNFDVTSQIWIVAPFAVDLLHAVVSLISQADARGAMNLVLFSSLLYLTWSLSEIVNNRLNDRLLIITLFATTPLLASLLTGLQTELFLAVLATAGTLFSLQRRRSNLSGAEVAAIIMVSALCCATKLPGAILGLALLVTFSFKVFSRPNQIPTLIRHDYRGIVIITLVAGLVAFHSYGVAWHLTGNPLFPLYNGYFKSPYFGLYNFIDNHYTTGTTLKTYWDLFFNTSRHFESANFVAGFQYLLLLPLSIIILLTLRSRRASLKIMLPLFVFGAVMFSAVQYWRYLFPVLPLGSVLIGVLLLDNSDKVFIRVIAFSTLGIYAAANLFFLPGISWYFSTPAQKAFSESNRHGIVANLAAEQLLNAILNKRAPGAKVLYEPSRPYGATLNENPIYVNWYSPARQAKVESIRTADDLTDFLRNEHIQYVYWDQSIPADVNDLYRTLLRDHLSRFGSPEFQEGSILAYQLMDHPKSYRKAVHINNFQNGSQVKFSTPASFTDSGALLVGGAPLMVREFDAARASSARYTVKLQCPVIGVSFVAQINWDVGSPYYRLVNCNKPHIEFSESVPVPAGAKRGLIYLSSHDQRRVNVSEVLIELN